MTSVFFKSQKAKRMHWSKQCCQGYVATPKLSPVVREIVRAFSLAKFAKPAKNSLGRLGEHCELGETARFISRPNVVRNAVVQNRHEVEL